MRSVGRVEITGLLTTVTAATDRGDGRGAAGGRRAAGLRGPVLGDVRSYREQSLEGTGITPLFPLWARPTAELAADMIAQGLRAVITCGDPAQAPAELVGRWYDEQLLRELPAGVDPCGERGEFHTFVVDGPGFATSLHVAVGEITERDGFVFADLLPT